MSTKQTTIIQCDHLHTAPTIVGQRCEGGGRVEDIPETEPMYHLDATISTIDSNGQIVLLKRSMDLCFWCLYHELSGIYDYAKLNKQQRKEMVEHLAEEARKQEEARNNDD